MIRKTRQDSSGRTANGARTDRVGLTRVTLSGSALGAMAFTAPVFAADPPQANSNDQSDQSVQEVVVTGIRASLQKSLEIKQNSLGVVDAISAEDIGQFPDTTLGDAMQRVPGVTVSRVLANTGMGLGSGAAVSIGDASGITVRGFGGDFNETLIDGRPMASAVGRAFDYSSVGAEFVGEVDVLKTPDFALSSGAVGATVDIKFPKPFDHPGRQARAFASTWDYANNGQFTPAFGALFSDTFADNTFGILLDGDYTMRKDNEPHFDIVGWEGTYLNSCQMTGGPACRNADGTVMPYNSLTMNAGNSTTAKNNFPSWFIQDYSLYYDRTYDRRKDGRAVIQWHPTDAVMVTVNDDYSDDRVLTYRSEYSVWFNSSSMYNVSQDGNGTITNFTYGPAPTDFDATYNGTYVKNNSFGLNVRWDVNDRLTTEFDASQSASHLNPGGEIGSYNVDVGYGPSAPGGTNAYVGGIAVPGGDSLPYPTAFGPNNNKGNVLGTGILGSHVFPVTQQINSDYINQVKFNAGWHNDNTTVNAGVQFVEDTRNAYANDTFTNNAWQLWAGYGSPSKNANGKPLPDSLFGGAVSTANFLPGWGNNGLLPSGLLQFDPYAVANYLYSLGPAGANPGTIPAGYPAYTGGSIPLALSPGTVNFIQEKTWSPFVTFQRKLSLGDMPFTASFGLRYEKTDVTTGGIERLPATLTVSSGDRTNFVVGYGPSQNTTVDNSYHYFLPSLDLNLQVLPRLKARFDASRTLTRPPLNYITPTLTVQGARVNALTATGNNPNLLPYLSNNFDLGAEWYFADNSYLLADGFFKHVSQFPILQTINTTINGVIDPTTNQPAQWAVTTYQNAPSADVYGVELGWQQMLPLGFGFQVNGTIVHTNKPFDRHALTNQFAVPGLANSVNFVTFYQQGGFQARVALNWTAEQLLYFGQEQNTSSTGTEPTFARAQTHVDFTTSYEVNSHFSVFFEAMNLTDEQLVTHGRFDNQILNVIDYGRSFNMGVRAKL